MLRFVIAMILVVNSCTLFSPSTLIVQNNSDYNIEVKYSRGLKSESFIENGKGDYTEVYPGDMFIVIEIKELGFSRKEKLSVKSMENLSYSFSLNGENL